MGYINLKIEMVLDWVIDIMEEKGTAALFFIIIHGS